MMARPDVRFIDVGANLTSAEFRGEYFGRSNHEADLDVVCERARQAGVFRMIVTGSSLEDSRAALDLVQERPNLYSTLGIHPTRCSEVVDEAQALESLRNVWQNSSAQKKIVAIGECGLDYDRTQFCDISQQKRGFEMQFRLAEETKLPMFLHNRNTSGEFVEIVQRNRHRFSGGVVHSYTGTLDEAQTLIDLGLYIGINGCSLKTEENLQVVRKIPLNKILLETDCPYCEIRETHASNSMVRTRWTALDRKKYVKDHLVKGRSEPCMIRQVAEVVAAVQGKIDQIAPLHFPATVFVTVETTCSQVHIQLR